jgi:hypothetical protein
MGDQPVSNEQIKHNLALRHYLPLGQISAIWHLVEQLRDELGSEYFEEVHSLLETLYSIDQKVCADRYPMPKREAPPKRAKRSNR